MQLVRQLPPPSKDERPPPATTHIASDATEFVGLILPLYLIHFDFKIACLSDSGWLLLPCSPVSLVRRWLLTNQSITMGVEQLEMK